MPKAGACGVAVDLTECILAHLAQPFTIDDRELFISASIGIALSSSGPTCAGDLLRAADVAMYRAKSRPVDKPAPGSGLGSATNSSW